MTSLKTSIKTITYLSDIGCLEIQGASLFLSDSIAIPDGFWTSRKSAEEAHATASVLGVVRI